MSVTSNLHDKRALVLRLIVAEVLAKRGEGPLAPRFPRELAAPRPRPPAPLTPLAPLAKDDPTKPKP